MKKIFVLAIILIPVLSFAEAGFFIQGRGGFLVKVDPASAFEAKYPVLKGPALKDIPVRIPAADFGPLYLDNFVEPVVKDFFESAYILNESGDNYTLNEELVIETIDAVLVKKNIISNIRKEQRKSFNEYYKFDRKGKIYRLKKKIPESEKKQVYHKVKLLLIRIALLDLNSENEIPTGLDKSGMPMPHRFPRVFEAKSKAHIDVHFAWGFRFENDLSLGFSINLTNFVMPSLEIMLKYNFTLPNQTFEPYVGGVLYGGFLDGFPVGLNVIGGVEFFPAQAQDYADNFSISIEGRLGPVLYSKIYYDTGNNAEGIWKQFSLLLDGGIYFVTGYRWDRRNAN